MAHAVRRDQSGAQSYGCYSAATTFISLEPRGPADLLWSAGLPSMLPALVYEHGAVELIEGARIASITMRTIQNAGLDDIDPKHYGIRLAPARYGAAVS